MARKYTYRPLQARRFVILCGTVRIGHVKGTDDGWQWHNALPGVPRDKMNGVDNTLEFAKRSLEASCNEWFSKIDQTAVQP